jgi:exopolysaccharide biosynthesis polyprenyl glycosylphosphotransferase
LSTHPYELVRLAGSRSFPSEPSLSLKTQRQLFQIGLLVSDAFLLAVAFKSAFLVRFELQVALQPEVVPNPGFYPILVSLLIPVWIGVFALFGLYDLKHLLGGTAEYSRIFNASTAGAMAVVIVTFLAPGFVIARGWLVVSWILSILLVCSGRFALRRVVYALREHGYFLTPAVAVGTNSEALALVRQLNDWRSSGVRILGFVATNRNTLGIEESGAHLLGHLGEMTKIIERYEVEELIVAITAVSRDKLLGLFEQVDEIPNVKIRLSSGLFELLTTGVTVSSLGCVPFLSLNKLRLSQGEMLVKRIVDIGLSLGLLIALSPVLVVLSILVKLDSPGPVFYRRRVLGVGNREFDAFKFRTMLTNGDEVLESDSQLFSRLSQNHKLKQDPRVTGLGRWLRRYSLDELPQLVNVLLGQMSLVGPRMITRPETEKYGRLKMNLLTVKPGLTGLWQVSGRSDLSYDERVQLDMYYIRNYSVWWDFQILFVQTPPAVLANRGAY